MKKVSLLDAKKAEYLYKTGYEQTKKEIKNMLYNKTFM